MVDFTTQRLATFNPKDILFTWGGVPLPLGISAGNFVKLERVTKVWRLVIGTDGEAAPVRTNNSSGIVTFRMRQAAENATALSALLTISEITGLFVALRALPFILTDAPSGRTLWHAPQAMLEGWPADEFGTAENDREWVLITPSLLPFSGGRN